MPEEGEVASYVVRLEAVRSCLDALWARNIHPHFPAYLHLRQKAAVSRSLNNLRPKWKELDIYFAVPGGPPKSPVLRPFWDQKRTSGQEWYNGNWAGSFAPSSLREQLLKVLGVNDNHTYFLREGHPNLALKYLCYNQRLSATALGGFLLRDFAITTAHPPEPVLLAELFRTEFGIAGQDNKAEFDTLYTIEPPLHSGEWFQPWVPAA